jgi:hypothetical protein
MDFWRASLASRSSALLLPDMVQKLWVWANYGMDLRSRGERRLFIGCSSSLDMFCRAKNVSTALHSSRFSASSHESDSGPYRILGHMGSVPSYSVLGDLGTSPHAAEENLFDWILCDFIKIEVYVRRDDHGVEVRSLVDL